MAVADVNGDDRPDLILTNGCAKIGGGFCSAEGAVGVLLGNGDGTFQAAVTYPSGGFDNFNSMVAVADVNGDGKPDIVALNGCSTPCTPNLPPQGSVSILLGTGTEPSPRQRATCPAAFSRIRWPWPISMVMESLTWWSRTGVPTIASSAIA